MPKSFLSNDTGVPQEILHPFNGSTRNQGRGGSVALIASFALADLDMNARALSYHSHRAAKLQKSGKGLDPSLIASGSVSPECDIGSCRALRALAVGIDHNRTSLASPPSTNDLRLRELEKVYVEQISPLTETCFLSNCDRTGR